MTAWTTNEVIDRVVKRTILISERGTILTLNDLPDWMVEEARAIARESLVSAVRYLRFYVATQNVPGVPGVEDFIEDVLLKGQDARTWGIRDCVLIPWPPSSSTNTKIQCYRDAIEDTEGERWFRIRPKTTDRPSDYTAGMVGVVQRNCRYWNTAPQGVDRYSLTRPEDIEVISPSQVESSIRRWIAHRLAWWARSYVEQNRAHVTANGIIDATSDSEMAPATSDVQIAAVALAREAHAYGGSPDFPQQAGFLGPEEWYQSPSQEVASTDAPTSSDKGSHD